MCKEIEVPELGGVLTFEKLPLATIFSLIDNANKAETTQESFDSNVELVYKHCPLLRSKELQEMYKCVEPYDVVVKIFNDNVGAINKLSEQMLDFYGLREAKEEIKN